MNPRLDKVLRVIEGLLVGAVLGFVYCRHVKQVPFHPDESQWIATSFYFEALFKHSGVLPEWTAYDVSFKGQPVTIWVENYWTLTQPPIPRYFIAIGRLIGGYSVEVLNYPWQFGLGYEENLELGAMPSPGLLWWSRLPMALLTVASGLILFSLLRNGVNRSSAYGFLVLFILTPYFSANLCRAMGEASVLFFSTLAIHFSSKLLLSARRLPIAGKRKTFSIWGWMVGMSVAVGLAGASKLNGLLILVAVVLIILAVGIPTKNRLLLKKYGLSLIRMVIVSLFIIGIVFVFVNPYLYPNPIYRTALMIKFRGHEMALQQSLYPGSVIAESSRSNVLFTRLFQDYVPFHFQVDWLIYCVFCGIGLYFLLRSSYRWFKGEHSGEVAVAILLVLLTVAVPSLFTPLDWDRYYMFPVAFISICTAIGVGSLLSFLVRQRWHTRGVNEPR